MAFEKMPGKVSISLTFNPMWTQPCPAGPWVANDHGQSYCAQFPTECSRSELGGGSVPQQYQLDDCHSFNGPHLLLSNFHIAQVKPRAFAKLQLASLSLSNNALATLAPLTFNALRVSGNLDLRNNSIAAVTQPMLSGIAGAFEALSAGVHLDIVSCLVVAWCGTVFGTLNLLGNPVAVVDYRLLDRADVQVVLEGVLVDPTPCLEAGNGMQLWGRGIESLVCAACPLGSFCPAHTPAVIPCLNGTFADAVGLSACHLCGAGTYSNVTGAVLPTTCLPCSPGTASPTIGAFSNSTCVPCAVASFSVAPGSHTCTKCPPRYAGTTAIGSSSLLQACSPCPIGTQPSNGLETCETCEPGYVSDGTACTPCGAGQFAGEAKCFVCPRHTYATVHQDQCDACVDHTGLSCYDGVPSIKPGYWLPPPAPLSRAVPLHTRRVLDAATAANNTDLNAYTSLAEALERSAALYLCHPPSACPYETNTTTVICRDGYTGVLCAACQSGWVRSGEECVRCHEDNRLNLALTVFCGVALVVAVVVTVRSALNAWRRSNTNSKAVMDVFKSMINFLQFLMLWKQYRVPYPKVVDEMWGAAGTASTIPVNSAFITCATGITYKGKLAVVLSAPWVTTLVVLAIPLVARVRASYQRRPPQGGAHSTPATAGGGPWATFQTVLIMGWFMIYPQVC